MKKAIFALAFFSILFYLAYSQIDVSVEPNIVNASQSVTLTFNISLLNLSLTVTSLNVNIPPIFSRITSHEIERGFCQWTSDYLLSCSGDLLNEVNSSLILNLSGNIEVNEIGYYTFVFEIPENSTNISIEVKDVTMPFISIISPLNNSKLIYSEGVLYNFSVLVKDDVKVDCVEFYLSENFVESKCVGKKESLVNFSVYDLPAGNYNFSFSVNDTGGNKNYSEIYFFEVEKAPNMIDIFLDGIKNNNITVVNGSRVEINITSKGCIYAFLNDSSLYSPCKEDFVNLSYTFTKIGYYSLFVNSTGNQNYTSNSSGVTYWVRVIYPRLNYTILRAPSEEKYAPGKSYEFKINFTSPSYPENNITNVSFSIGGKEYYFSISNPQSQVFSFIVRDLKAGEYTWSFCGEDSQNEKVCYFGNLKIEKATPYLDIYNTGDYGVPVNKTIIAIGCPEQLVCEFYLNNTKLSELYYDLITDKPGYYIFTFNTSGNENYTSYQITKVVRVFALKPNISTTNESANRTNETQTTITEENGRLKHVYNFSSVMPNIINVENEELVKIRQIVIEVKSDQNNIYLEVKTPTQLPSKVPPGNVFLFLEISTNISEDLIRNVKIRFKVDKSWIDSNKIDSLTIALYRWDGNEWEKLNTEKLSEDENFVYFESYGEKLSLLAISGEKIKGKFPWHFVLIIVIVIFIGIILYLFLPPKNIGLEIEKFKSS
ncbi:MAG: PGF-pre-PGF domain-containing protein [Candidatus Aenigmatarchaeota archaeon]